MTDTLPIIGQVQIDTQDSFWIENHHPSATLRFVWGKLPYTIGPGKKKIVPFEVVCLYFGDPRSKVGAAVPYKDSRGSGTVPERLGEVRRLSVRYGVYEQGMDNIAEAITAENARLAEIDANSIKKIKPLISDNFYAEIYTLEDQKVITPLFDHDGTTTYGYSLDDERSDDIATIINQMRRRIEHLEGVDAVLDGGDNTDDGIKIDNPGSGPEGGIELP